MVRDANERILTISDMGEYISICPMPVREAATYLTADALPFSAHEVIVEAVLGYKSDPQKRREMRQLEAA
jgi:hypothetical protein